MIVLAALAPACPRPRVCKRKLLYIAGAQDDFRIGPVLRIEERIATDRDRRIGLGDLAELHPDVAFARIRAHRKNTSLRRLSATVSLPTNRSSQR